MIAELRKRGLMPLAERVARAHFVTVAQIEGKDRHKSISAARMVLCVELHLAGLSYPEIGRVLGGRDHTTIMHYVKRARVRVAVADANTERAA